MTDEVSKPGPVDNSHRDPAFAAQAPKEEAKPNAAQEAQHEDADNDGGEQNESEQSAATETDDAQAAPPKPRGVQKRLDELTREKHEARREADHWREMAMRNNPPKPEAPAREVESQSSDEPTMESCEFDVPRYTKEWHKWNKAQESKAAEQAKAQQAVVERQQKFQASAAEFAAQAPDFEQLISNPALPFTDTMFEAVTESDNPAAIAYHLAKNPQEAAVIAAMTPAAVGRAIAKIESQVASGEPARQPTQKTVTQAPPPPTILSGTKTPSKKLDEMSMAEYALHRAEERKAKGLRP